MTTRNASSLTLNRTPPTRVDAPPTMPPSPSSIQERKRLLRKVSTCSTAAAADRRGSKSCANDSKRGLSTGDTQSHSDIPPPPSRVDSPPIKERTLLEDHKNLRPSPCCCRVVSNTNTTTTVTTRNASSSTLNRTPPTRVDAPPTMPPSPSSIQERKRLLREVSTCCSAAAAADQPPTRVDAPPTMPPSPSSIQERKRLLREVSTCSTAAADRRGSKSCANDSKRGLSTGDTQSHSDIPPPPSRVDSPPIKPRSRSELLQQKKGEEEERSRRRRLIKKSLKSYAAFDEVPAAPLGNDLRPSKPQRTWSNPKSRKRGGCNNTCRPIVTSISSPVLLPTGSATPA